VLITSAAVSEPPAGMYLSSGPRAGLTAVMKGLSREVARHNVTINALVPRRFDTSRQVEMAKRQAEKTGISFAEARARQQGDSPAGRLGIPLEFGSACAYLCGATGGYITGESLILDGGSRRGLESMWDR
jgi:3-oxoacyl-[acyl-carrier protein] reductase